MGRICGLLFGAILLVAECVSVPEIRHGNLVVIATDLTGQQLNNVEADLFQGESRIAEIRTSGTKVRYGDYRLRVRAPGFRFGWRELSIAQPETTVRIDHSIATIGCPLPPRSIGGRIIPRGEGDVWVKVTPLRGTGGGEAPVGPSGDFLVSGLDFTSYVVLVARGEDILHHQVVNPIDTDTSRLVIRLGKQR